MSSPLDTEDSRSKKRSFTGNEKMEAVLRLLRGENVGALSSEFGASVERLKTWEQRFLDAGHSALAQRKHRSGPSLWDKRQAVLQWTAVVVALLLTVFVITRFFDGIGPLGSP